MRQELTRPLISLTLVLLFGCSPKTANLQLPIETPSAFSESSTHPRTDRWWAAFGDDRMTALVDSALVSNFSLESAWHRLRGAQAVVDRESASFIPSLDGAFRGEAERSDAGNDETLRLGISSEYELDLWGRIRSEVDAERYRARATQADYQTAALSVSAEVVRTWYQLIEARNQIDLFEQQIETNRQVLSLIRTRLGTGQVRSVDILRQKQLLESTREQKLAMESRRGVLEHQLSVLLGRPPQDRVAYTPAPLPDLPPLPDAGLPSDLIRRRPDVLKAYNLLHAADRDLASAVADRYPRLTLSASSSSTNDNGGLLDGWIHNFTAGLLAPLFDGGERGAEVKRSRALKDERLYDYGQTVLLAFREVENALIQEKKQTERIKSIEEQSRLVSQTYNQLRLEYLNGLSGYLDVLTALTNEQRIGRDLISARGDLLGYRIALYRALAGGFETERESE